MRYISHPCGAQIRCENIWVERLVLGTASPDETHKLATILATWVLARKLLERCDKTDLDQKYIAQVRTGFVNRLGNLTFEHLLIQREGTKQHETATPEEKQRVLAIIDAVGCFRFPDLWHLIQKGQAR